MKRSGLKPSLFRLGERDSKRGVRHSATTKIQTHGIQEREEEREKEQCLQLQTTRHG